MACAQVATEAEMLALDLARALAARLQILWRAYARVLVGRGPGGGLVRRAA